jgi:Glycosyl transferase family 2
MPTYNGERFVTAALDSVRQQSSEDIEVVVVDDCSSDNTRQIVSHFEQSLRIRLLTPGRIGNWVAITNLALREAQGEWACFLHQDDFWLPGRIAKVREEISRAKGKMVLHNATFVGPDGRALGPWTCPFSAGEIAPSEFLERLLVQNFIAIPSPVFLRNAVLDSGGLDESLWFSADWDLWLRLGAMGPVRFSPERLAAFRVHSTSQTVSRKLSPGDWEKQLTTVLDRHLSCAVPMINRERVRKVAIASVFVNSALASASRGLRMQPLRVLIKLLSLGPSGLRRYLKDSRILERVRSRLKIRDHLG